MTEESASDFLTVGTTLISVAVAFALAATQAAGLKGRVVVSAFIIFAGMSAIAGAAWIWNVPSGWSFTRYLPNSSPSVSVDPDSLNLIRVILFSAVGGAVLLWAIRRFRKLPRDASGIQVLIDFATVTSILYLFTVAFFVATKNWNGLSSFLSGGSAIFAVGAFAYMVSALLLQIVRSLRR